MVESKPPCDTPRDLSKKCSTVLQWTPAHCGIGGNERADRLAKEGGRQAQPLPSLSNREVETLTKKIKNKKRWTSVFSEKNGDYWPAHPRFHSLSPPCRADSHLSPANRILRSEDEPEQDRHRGVCSVTVVKRTRLNSTT